MTSPLPITSDRECGPRRPAAARLHLLSLSADSLRQWLTEQGHPPYRATQLLQWIYAHGASSFDAMSNLPLALRAWLADHATLLDGETVAEARSADGTRKLLLRWSDAATVETVWIPEPQRQTACLSSQVGCPVGCRFCASGLEGVSRNLTAGEIVEQALRVHRCIAQDAPPRISPTGRMRPARLTNVVLMGMGEPLANYDAVVQAIRILNAPWGLNIGARHITLSTVGLPKQIRRLADEGLAINLALSLHAPDDDLRTELIPWARSIALAQLIDACTHYFRQTGREITLEYVLLAGVNDGPRQADQLTRIVRQLRCNVNLLRYNPVGGLPYERPSAEAAQRFLERLRRHGVNAHIRRSRGRDVEAACGQLRRARLGPPPAPAETQT